MNKHHKYPESCCARGTKTCEKPKWEHGCASPVRDAINGNAVTLIGIVCGYLGIQFVSMVLGCCLVSSIRKDYFSFV